MPEKQINKRKRMEKKEKLENAEEGVKIRFVLFISFLFCGLRVCLNTTYFAKIENLLLKVL